MNLRQIDFLFHLTLQFLFKSCAFLRQAEFLRVLSFFLKAADGFLRVWGRRQNLQVPRGRQTISAEPLQDHPISDDLGGADTAITADGERQETVRENLGVWDTAGLAVGEHFSLTNGAQAAMMRCTEDMERRCHFPVSHQHKVCSRCRAESDKKLRDLSHVWLSVDLDLKAEWKYREMWEMKAFCATCCPSRYLDLQPEMMRKHEWICWKVLGFSKIPLDLYYEITTATYFSKNIPPLHQI